MQLGPGLRAIRHVLCEAFTEELTRASYSRVQGQLCWVDLQGRDRAPVPAVPRPRLPGARCAYSQPSHRLSAWFNSSARGELERVKSERTSPPVPLPLRPFIARPNFSCSRACFPKRSGEPVARLRTARDVIFSRCLNEVTSYFRGVWMRWRHILAMSGWGDVIFSRCLAEVTSYFRGVWLRWRHILAVSEWGDVIF